MFLRIFGAFLLALFLMKPVVSLAQSEEERRKGFYKQQEENKEYEREREAGLKDYLKDQADWEEQRKKDRAADKNRKKEESPLEDGPEYKANQKQRLEYFEEYEAVRKDYLKNKKALEPKNASEKAKRDAWALEEYGLDKERPRFDIAKRNMFGGKPGGSTPGFGTSGNFGATPNFPPAPAFDDDGGYVPPPFPPSEPFEQPDFPPPPQMPMPGPGEPMGGDFDSGYFPPPPPPVPMGDDGF